MKAFVHFAGLAVFVITTMSAQNVVAQGTPRIFVSDKDGNDVKLLVEIPDAGYHGSPHWGADGKIVLINASPGNRQFQLSRIYACAIGGPFSGNVADMGCGSCARFSPDMSHIAFQVRAGNPDRIEPGVWIMRDDGTERTRLCPGTRPRWTPDGKRLIFLNEEGTGLEIISIDGTGKRPILKNSISIAGAAVSPDGKEVSYIAYPREAYDGILYRVPLTDGQADSKVIYRGQIGWDPAWSPDGSQIMFWQIDEKANRRLVVIDADGRAPPKTLASQEGTHYTTDAEWSPDGQRIIFSSDREPPPK